MSDYVAPAAMSSWRKRRLSQVNPPTELPREVLATIIIIGEPGSKAATHLGRNYDKISPHHRRSLRVSPIGMCIVPQSLRTIRFLRDQADIVAHRAEAR